MVRIKVVCVTAAIIVSAFGCGNGPAELEGTWHGKELGQNAGDGMCQLVVEGTRLEYSGRAGAEWYSGTIFLHRTKNPKQVDLLVENCAHEPYIGNTIRGIYKIDAGVPSLRPTSQGGT